MAKQAEKRSSIDASATDSFLDEYLPYWLTQASRSITKEFHREVEREGLSNAEWRVLASLHGSAGETIGALCRLAAIKQPTLSKLVQRLEAENLVLRQPIASDRRQTSVTSTPKGRARIDALVSKARAQQRAVLQPFGSTNSRQLMDMLKELVQQREHAGSPGAAPMPDEGQGT